MRVYVACVLFLICSFLMPVAGAVTNVEVKNFNITGNSSIPSPEILLRLNGYIGTAMSLEELKAVAKDVTLLYQEKGFLLARSYIPNQKINDGIVTVAVSEGDIGQVDVGETLFYSKNYIKRLFKRFEGKALNENELKRSVLLANDTPSLKTSVVLKKGTKPGTANALVNVEDSNPIKLNFAYNNYGNHQLSKNYFGGNLSFTDPFLGSTLTLMASRGDDVSNTFYWGLDYNIPLNASGTKVGAHYIKAEYLVGDGDFKVLGIEGDSEIFGVYLSHPFIRSERENLKGIVAVDIKDFNAYTLGQQTSNDKLSALSFKLEYDNIDQLRGKNYISLSYSHGFNNLFGSLGEQDPNASRFNADGKYDKINFDYSRVQRLWADDVLLVLKTSGQYGATELTYPEQFSIGGASSVRGHQLAKYIGDSGYTVSTEFISALPFDTTIASKKLSEMLQFVIFADYGKVYRHSSIPGDQKQKPLASAGVGLRLHLFDNLEVKIDVPYLLNGDEKGDKNSSFEIGLNLKVIDF
ncbi:MAG: ShlB/FhaC/HecB family hemolysin secretion/activation protein [Gammaproteobacteria bacterium]|nr:ShlB/FhaC/HecB family hemolysin secretion/activation protein [Gammaproteobacteria bacterium]MBQ0841304.1 ShlB/FhaC/HecB family hemolysin secretion/activation protein [Gammaproteobacteria bacterium]